jgi:hypothetical protein
MSFLIRTRKRFSTRPGLALLANEGSSETVKANLAEDLHGLEDSKIGLIFKSIDAKNKTPALVLVLTDGWLYYSARWNRSAL